MAKFITLEDGVGDPMLINTSDIVCAVWELEDKGLTSIALREVSGGRVQTLRTKLKPDELWDRIRRCEGVTLDA